MRFITTRLIHTNYYRTLLLVVLFHLPTILLTQSVPTATEQELRLIEEGLASYYKYDYDEAITKYTTALEVNPQSIRALYELAYTYMESGKYIQSLNVAQEGVKYQSSLLPDFYDLITINYQYTMIIAISEHELLSRNEEEIQEAIRRFPKMEYAPKQFFELALTFEELGRHNDAIPQYQQVIRYEPNHAEAHFMLARLFDMNGLQPSAALAYIRFLSLEPGTVRKERALVRLGNALGRTDSSYSLPLAAADLQEFLQQLTLEKAESSQPGITDFASGYYLPFVRQLRSQQLLETFSHFICQRGGSSPSGVWCSQHQADVTSLMEWIEHYPWPIENYGGE